MHLCSAWYLNWHSQRYVEKIDFTESYLFQLYSLFFLYRSSLIFQGLFYHNVVYFVSLLPSINPSFFSSYRTQINNPFNSSHLFFPALHKRPCHNSFISSNICNTFLLTLILSCIYSLSKMHEKIMLSLLTTNRIWELLAVRSQRGAKPYRLSINYAEYQC